jgi:hypothetical protein
MGFDHVGLFTRIVIEIIEGQLGIRHTIVARRAVAAARFIAESRSGEPFRRAVQESRSGEPFRDRAVQGQGPFRDKGRSGTRALHLFSGTGHFTCFDGNKVAVFLVRVWEPLGR